MISIEQLTVVSLTPASKDSVSPIVMDAISKYWFDMEFLGDATYVPGEHIINHFEDDPQIAQAVHNWFRSLKLDPEQTLIRYWW